MSFANSDANWSRTRGVWTLLGESRTAQVASSAGFGWSAIDMQHGRWDDAGMVRALEVMAGPVLVRVRSLDDGLVGRALDAGAAGVIAPMVDSPDDARRLVAASAYPPAGRRSWGPIVSGYGAADAPPARVFAMIESRGALDRVEEIAAVAGLDGLFVGPFDLALALGMPVDDLLHDATDLRRIARAAEQAGLVAGAFAGTPERATRLERLGFGFVAATTDEGLLARGAREVLADRGRATS
ncbi:HpcH/HpaI aldolase family protein [Agromyces sp. SYSU T00194]|uniref:HpcH/HpaI aldolase family protein n=1 Tax=Agromyces chitinivorans TaxID=3158560 RepID=UPI00339742F0